MPSGMTGLADALRLRKRCGSRHLAPGAKDLDHGVGGAGGRQSEDALVALCEECLAERLRRRPPRVRKLRPPDFPGERDDADRSAEAEPKLATAISRLLG